LKNIMKKSFRTFVAVEIDKPIRARAKELIDSLAGTSADVKWVETHNMHLTLKFLGEVHEREIFEVCQAVERGAVQVESFELEVCGAGAFPNAARPRTLWLGAKEGTEPMIQLHDRIEAELAELGYREEHRRFQVHLTIGRVRGGENGKRGPSPYGRRAAQAEDSRSLDQGIVELGELLQLQSDFAAGSMTVDKVSVFASTLTSDGPIYERLGVASLGGNA
jgi:RNA 2',3'-cyclic 3'-phosphodiesterase